MVVVAVVVVVVAAVVAVAALVVGNPAVPEVDNLAGVGTPVVVADNLAVVAFVDTAAALEPFVDTAAAAALEQLLAADTHTSIKEQNLSLSTSKSIKDYSQCSR